MSTYIYTFCSTDGEFQIETGTFRAPNFSTAAILADAMATRNWENMEVIMLEKEDW